MWSLSRNLAQTHKCVYMYIRCIYVGVFLSEYGTIYVSLEEYTAYLSYIRRSFLLSCVSLMFDPQNWFFVIHRLQRLEILASLISHSVIHAAWLCDNPAGRDRFRAFCPSIGLSCHQMHHSHESVFFIIRCMSFYLSREFGTYSMQHGN